MLDVKTPLSKIHRATKQIVEGFVAVPGIWAVLSSDVLNNVATTNDAGDVYKLVLGNASDSVYESHDIKVGSISIIEGEVRATVGSESVVFTGLADGKFLTVSTDSASLGKLILATTGDLIVARVDSIVAGETVTFMTTSQSSLAA